MMPFKSLLAFVLIVPSFTLSPSAEGAKGAFRVLCEVSEADRAKAKFSHVLIRSRPPVPCDDCYRADSHISLVRTDGSAVCEGDCGVQTRCEEAEDALTAALPGVPLSCAQFESVRYETRGEGYAFSLYPEVGSDTGWAKAGLTRLKGKTGSVEIIPRIGRFYSGWDLGEGRIRFGSCRSL